MMDAAVAASMSDPILNRWFRRRWITADVITVTAEPEQSRQTDQLDLHGRELLEAWRQERAALGRDRKSGDTPAMGVA